jgi:hypothetical protein
MGAIAAVAFILAVLPMSYAVPLAVAAFGIIVLNGMRLPIVTDGTGRRRWLPWAVWLAALLACPAAMWGVAAMMVKASPRNPGGPAPSRDFRPLEGLIVGQVAASVVASVAVVVLTRGHWRWLAWAAILVIGALAAFTCVCAALMLAYG